MHVRGLANILVCMSSLYSFVGLAQKQAEERCTVEINEPKQGGSVSSRSKAEGSATIPPGKHLWIFAHVEGLAIWWPQCGGPASIEKPKWSCLVTYGEDRDRGSDFEVIAVVLDEKDNNDMLNVIHDYERTKEYSGVSLPPPAEGCPTAKAKVTRK